MESSHQARILDMAADHYFQRRDEASKQEAAEAASGLIRYYARLYGGSCDRDDLYQVGSMGLLKALLRFDPTQSAGFSTYASHCIMGEIRHWVRKQASYYRPGCIVELQFKVDRAMEAYARLHGDVPPASYVARALNVKTESVDEVMKAGLVSFDEIDTSKIHSTAYESFHLPIEDKITLYQAMKKLTDLQRKVIHMLFYGDMTQQQVADKMGLTQKKVSRIKEKSLQAMRDYMREDLPPEDDPGSAAPAAAAKRPGEKTAAGTRT